MYDIENQLTSSNLNIYVGRKLKERRVTLKITQMELSQALSVSCQQLQKYENGINNISLGTLYKISKILSVEIEYFFEGYGGSPSCRDLHEENSAYNINLVDKEAVLLSKYFKKITSDDVRKKILSLVKSLSGSENSELGEN